MNQHDIILQVLQAREGRRTDRRKFIKIASQGTAVVGGAALLGGCFDDDDDDVQPTPTPSPTPTPTPPPAGITDADVLNFALNLEYLEAQFYAFAATGAGLPSNLLDGRGQQGAVTGGRQVAFQDPLVAQYAREIAADERAHVAFLRQAIGATAVAQPAIDISASASGAFSAAARAAGLVAAGQSFDPYASDENFLLGAYIFEDVGVTAYKGASPLITNKTFLEAAAGILAAEAYHAGLVRTVLFRKGIQTPALVDASEAISNARDSLDGASDLDQGVRSRDTPFGAGSNIVPTDANAIAFSRTTGQVLNIAYLNAMATDRGGFFPNGVNGDIRLSAG
ncbi:ferritin-like domain-containing protein [Qipengyuania sp. MTN3-11]|uniref:ferritin-like domain-containing protein n=1 Tax=Qipengyuania sp. MTN3-11 TaxID=3056557 RepID=UPI0036F39636